MSGGYTAYSRPMPGLNVGYARVSTDQRDLTAQRDGLHALGVQAERIYVDHGLTGTNRRAPRLAAGPRCMPMFLTARFGEGGGEGRGRVRRTPAP